MANKITLGKIKRIDDLRSVWENEQYDFSPWLAKNINILSDTLDMSLNIVDQESPVGAYSLDLLAEDQDSGEIVIIENQLEQTDHEHLGKLITYASGKRAKSIIWIVKNARDEHKAAIEWLNENTNEEIKFFLIEIQLWQIDDSISAPKFEIIEGPNNWSKTIKNAQRSQGGPAVQFKYNFWSGFNDYAFASSNDFSALFKKHKASSDHWYTLNINSSLRHLSLLVNTRTEVVAVELCLNNGSNKTDFDKLFSCKEEIEKELGLPLVWKRLDDKSVSRILLEKQTSLKDEEKLSEIFDWYMEYAVKIYKVFKKRFKK